MFRSSTTGVALQQTGTKPSSSKSHTHDGFRVKLVEVVDDEERAKLISDPMRRAILNLLRKKPLTEAELAESLGLTDATVNYHLNLLRGSGFISIVKEELEEHGIMQKFYAPTAFLYLPDVASLPKQVARYYYPINIERARGILGALATKEGARDFKGEDIDKMGEDLAKALVDVARGYAGRVVNQGEGEPLVNKIYIEALSVLKSLP